LDYTVLLADENMNMQHQWNYREKRIVLQEKPLPMPFGPQQIAQAVLWDETWALTVRSL
jgi:hypothetical protein